MRIAPLNGRKTHPLSKHAIGVLQRLALESIPVHEVNPGVINRFMREGLAQIRGGRLLEITHAGRSRLQDGSP